ncbi:antirestriction protein, partial [Salmonella enterica subsp. enterica serovar Typhimurium]|nr:antirestriction protein [Salmonella enterica subsp. enterica serovar Typhimurium]
MREGEALPFLASTGGYKSKKDVAAGSASPGHDLKAMSLWFSTLRLPRCDGLCRASIVAG